MPKKVSRWFEPFVILYFCNPAVCVHKELYTKAGRVLINFARLQYIQFSDERTIQTCCIFHHDTSLFSFQPTQTLDESTISGCDDETFDVFLLMWKCLNTLMMKGCTFTEKCSYISMHVLNMYHSYAIAICTYILYCTWSCKIEFYI